MLLSLCANVRSVLWATHRAAASIVAHTYTQKHCTCIWLARRCFVPTFAQYNTQSCCHKQYTVSSIVACTYTQIHTIRVYYVASLLCADIRSVYWDARNTQSCCHNKYTASRHVACTHTPKHSGLRRCFISTFASVKTGIPLCNHIDPRLWTDRRQKRERANKLKFAYQNEIARDLKFAWRPHADR